MAASQKTPAQKPRRTPRKRVLFGGKIVHDDGAFSVDCVIRDVSDTGAKITLGQRVSIPNEVYFIELREGVAYRAEVAWRHSPNFGLRFLQRIDLETAPKELAYLKRLWNVSAFRR